MIYIVTALKSEAQAFVDYYKLTKSKLGDFTLFSNDKIFLLVSGMGVVNARLGTQTLINHFDISDEDIYLNIGICGASKEFALGELLEIGTIEHKEQKHRFKERLHTITCVDEPQHNATHTIVDMESFGFYDAVKHNPAIKNFFIFKVVSDHFEPQTVTKDKTKALIFNKIDTLKELI